MSWSWEGEDILTGKICADYLGVKEGFYVDVGAHHPLALSNTHVLYKRGWRGINIDAMPGSMVAFAQYRPEDRNIECAVSLKPSTMMFSMFDDAGLNGFLPQAMIDSHVRRGCKLVGQTPVTTKPLSQILDEADAPTTIDMMDVDVEGLDIEVLESNDWNRWRPKVILAEILGCSDVRSVMNSDVAKYLEGRNYRLFSRLHFSSLFMDAALVR